MTFFANNTLVPDLLALPMHQRHVYSINVSPTKLWHPFTDATYTCRQPNDDNVNEIILMNMNNKQILLGKQPGVPLPPPGHLLTIDLTTVGTIDCILTIDYYWLLTIDYWLLTTDIDHLVLTTGIDYFVLLTWFWLPPSPRGISMHICDFQRLWLLIVPAGIIGRRCW